ncbi:Mediator of RNA polymerase II transcription subunit 13 [Nymphon striatum]|nr:Mediator of RNA polymerase II transcription subunit 13 [Nymphon striatum]
MTHPNSVTNGASLEDCHTNFFALTDLCGIKWRKLCVENLFCVDPLDDPVLVSYTKCLTSDILCVWRRVPSSNSPYPGGLDHGHSQQRSSDSHQLNYPKELWIFWYGDEPDLSKILCPELSDSEQGSWEMGLSYECRTLLFKALHNLIERYLLSHDFTRLERWFLQPHPGGGKGSKSPHLSFKFNFFVHGESTVCASVDVREHPAICKLNASHILQAHSNQNGIPVILSPFGLQAVLTGQTCKESQQANMKLLEEWRQFYPLSNSNTDHNSSQSNFQENNSLPPMVEVIFAGVKMRYPSSYVFVTEEDIQFNERCGNSNPEMPTMNSSLLVSAQTGMNSQLPVAPLTPPASPCNNSPVHLKPSIVDWSFPDSVRNKSNYTPKLIYRVYQDNTIIPGQNKIQDVYNVTPSLSQTDSDTAMCQHEDSIGQWDLCDPSRKAPCVCTRLKNKKSSSPSTTGGKPMSSNNTSSNSTLNKKGEKIEKQHSKHNRGINAFHRRSPVFEDRNNFDLDMMSRKVLANTVINHQPPVISGNQTEGLPQLRSVSNSGQTEILSSVSPHSVAPSPLLASSSNQLSQPAQPASDPTMPTLSPHPPLTQEQENIPPNQENSEEVKSVCLKSPASVRTPHSQDQIKTEQIFSPYNNNPSVDPKPSSEPSQWPQQNAPATPSSNTGFSIAETCGIKRPVLASLNYEEYRIEDLSCGLLYDYTLLNAWMKKPIENLSAEPSSVDMSIVKEEPGTESESPSTPKPLAQASSFTREKDLIVGFNDLDQIFDTSGDDSDGDNGDNSFQAHTPPGSNKPITNTSSDESTTVKNKSNSTNAFASLGAAELVRMFPTPPSLEHNPAPSPLTTVDGTMFDVDWTSVSKDKNEMSIGSPMLDNVKDWSYVFKPSERQIFVRSSKYSPLSNLPSSQLPPITLPSDCVYKPWQRFPPPAMEKTPIISHMNMLPPDVDRTPHGSVRSLMAPSPMMNISGNEQRLPMNYELPSPASNASSYLNKNMNSVDSNVISHIPEAHSLLVNVILSDSLLNIFKDHNFDSCTMCVCNLNIRGADAGIYLPGSLLPSRTDEAQYKCTCGFSAVRNRHLSYQAGLFYEDEYEITGIRDEGLTKRKSSLIVENSCVDKSQNNDHKSGPIEEVSQSIMDLILMQTVMSYCSASSLHRTALFPKEYKGTMLASSSSSSQKMSLEMMDACEVCVLARDSGRQVIDNINGNKLEDSLKYSSMHRWPHISAKPPTNSQDVIRVMKTIQPMLQDAIQKKRTTRLWETTYTVSGPLTWRQFHRLAGRGTEDQCEPQPVPSLLVGHDKDWLAVSPFAIKFWEKLLFEPYAVSRDVAYIVLAPENDYIIDKVRAYFKELSRVYEICHMGRHCPITRVLRDGIMRIGKLAAKKVADEPVDEWFDSIGTTPVASKLKLYAQVCRHRLAPHLATEQLDSSLLDSGSDSKSMDKQQNSVSPLPPSTPDNSEGNSNLKSDGCGDNSEQSNQSKDSASTKSPPATGSIQDPDPEDELQIPAIVIYMVDPFSYMASGDEYSEVHRLAMLGLLRCYADLLKNVPEKTQNNIHLQIVSLESILNYGIDEDKSKNLDQMKGLAFSVFTQCRRMLTHQSTVKSLTGFGTAASQDQFLSSKDAKNSKPYDLFSPAYILAPTKDKQTELSELFGNRREKSGILFCTYCLSEDQQWLLASCTDDRGEIMDTCAINIEIPNRTRRKKASARKVGLTKLVDFLLGVMSMRTLPWRLVVGRLGRMGHGELKGWNSLLSKKSLMRASKLLKEMCKQCSYLGPLDSPVILSACLVNIEPDSALTILPDQYTPDERFSSSCNSCPLSTPKDASCTHILVFPTSAITQSSQATFQQEHIDALGPEDIFNALHEDLQVVDHDINAIFNWTDSPVPSPVGSPQRGGSSQPCSPGMNGSGRQDLFQNHGQNQGSHSLMGDVQEETSQLAQQPLALGYFVSTAKTGPLPKWFWSSCSHLENSCPAFLKSALLIHSPSAQQSEDLLHSNTHVHPLDSNLTTDVLRYVLEGYNSLSWLSIDPTTHDRRSCLPVHIQVLMQMYHTMEALI